MRKAIKVIDLTQKLASYTINENSMVDEYLLTGAVTLDKDTAIVMNNPPINTVIKFIKTAKINLYNFNFIILGQKISSTIALYADMIYCVKIGPNAADWKRIYLMSQEPKFGGGIDITLNDVEIDPERTGNKQIFVKLTDIVDNKTLKIVNNKIVAAVASGDNYVANDDFTDSTSKDVVNGEITNDPMGVLTLLATASDNTASVNSKSPLVKPEYYPSIEIMCKITQRGTSTIMLGLINSIETPTAGAYFKLSTTSLEVFTVVNDGTERIVTSGVTIALNAFVKFRIDIDEDYKAGFYINDQLVYKNENYPVPLQSYYDVVNILNASADTSVGVDYVKMDMKRG